MKLFFSILFLICSSFANTEKVQEKKDFSVICAISKMSQTLSLDPLFAEKVDRVIVISNLMTTGIQSEEVKNVIKAVSSADPTQKIKLYHQAAKDVGLKNWQCKTLKYLF